MRFRSKTGLAVLATAATALGGAAPASAQEIKTDQIAMAALDPVTDCRQATVGSVIQKVCVSLGTRKVVSTTGTVTVAPFVSVTCPTPSVIECSPIGRAFGTTGFAANTAGPKPQLIPGGAYLPAGNLGTLYYNGSSAAINTPELCLGSEAACPGE